MEYTCVRKLEEDIMLVFLMMALILRRFFHFFSKKYLQMFWD